MRTRTNKMTQSQKTDRQDRQAKTADQFLSLPLKKLQRCQTPRRRSAATSGLTFELSERTI